MLAFKRPQLYGIDVVACNCYILTTNVNLHRRDTVRQRTRALLLDGESIQRN